MVNLYESIVNRDILASAKKIDAKIFKEIAYYILANADNEFSIDSIIKYYEQKGGKISRNTIISYIEKLEKAYLIHSVKKYNISGKKALCNNNKYYAIDNGFRIISTNTQDFAITFF